mgnify:CR=1 FL=1
MVCLFAAPKRHLGPSDLSSRKYNCHLSTPLTSIFWVKAMTSRTELGISSRRFLGNEQLQQLSSYCITIGNDRRLRPYLSDWAGNPNQQRNGKPFFTNILSCPVNPMQCLDDPDHFPASRQYLYFFNNIMQQRLKLLILSYLPIFLAHSTSHHAMCIYQSSFQPSSKISLSLSSSFVSCPPWILGRLLQKMSKVSVSLGHPLALIHAYANVVWGDTYAVERYLI